MPRIHQDSNNSIIHFDSNDSNSNHLRVWLSPINMIHFRRFLFELMIRPTRNKNPPTGVLIPWKETLWHSSRNWASHCWLTYLSSETLELASYSFFWVQKFWNWTLLCSYFKECQWDVVQGLELVGSLMKLVNFTRICHLRLDCQRTNWCTVFSVKNVPMIWVQIFIARLCFSYVTCYFLIIGSEFCFSTPNVE